jgi:hypothetical protein
MSGVIEYIECPHCGNEAWIDMDRWSEHMFCAHCGYTKQTFVSNLDEVAEGKLPQVETFLVDKPYGAYHVAYEDGTADAGSLHDASSAAGLLPEINKYREEIVEAYMTRFVDGEIIKTTLVEPKNAEN